MKMPVSWHLWWVLLVAANCAHPHRGVAVRLNDPKADAYGPGAYELPAHPDVKRGELDLRSVQIERTERGCKLKISFYERLHLFEIRPARDTPRKVFFPTVDFYFQTGDDNPVCSALPGRQVRISGGWQRAVVISPVPELAAEAFQDDERLRGRVWIAPRPRVYGRAIRVVVPFDFLGREWPRAMAVLVCASAFSPSFRLADRLRGGWKSGGAVMPVLPFPAGDCRLDGERSRACHLTGCKPCGGHPQVVDVLAPAGLQESWLSDYTIGRPATVEAHTVKGPAE